MKNIKIEIPNLRTFIGVDESEMDDSVLCGFVESESLEQDLLLIEDGIDFDYITKRLVLTFGVEDGVDEEQFKAQYMSDLKSIFAAQ
jgi:hypothetical protein